MVCANKESAFHVIPVSKYKHIFKFFWLMLDSIVIYKCKRFIKNI